MNLMTKLNKISCPRFLISALRGSGAKTIVSLGITVALKRRGLRVFPYKKGPDYIDAAWLSEAAGEECKHLDLFMMGEKGIKEVFIRCFGENSVSIIEGNRGLFDGVDIHGTYSTARIARLFDIPVILVVDCTKITNTISALISGCQSFDPNIQFAGVILNRVSGKRHGKIIRKSIQHHTGLPVLGELPKLDLEMPERHLGLTTIYETGDFDRKLEYLGDIAEKHFDLDKILSIARESTPLAHSQVKQKVKTVKKKLPLVRVGIIRDKAFQFYYPENLLAIEEEGAEIIEFDSMCDKSIKPVDILYIAGGFPEVFAEKISKNKSFRDSIRIFAEKGLPIYGECGAVIYLGRSITYKGQKFNMCGIFPLDFELSKKPAGHGYTEVKVDRENPFFPIGSTLKGHEFHYSIPTNWNPSSQGTAFSVKKGFGFDSNRDGIHKKNVFATYTHLHATGTLDWAKWLVGKARKTGFSESM
jgi:cobyrinic acid a,c-diamide synthase